MADVTIDNACFGDDYVRATRCMVTKTDQVVYAFYINAAKKVVYAKSTDGGQTFGAEVSALDTGEASNGYLTFGIWYDQWTSGDTGTVVHIVGQNWNDDHRYYVDLDVSSDTLGSAVDMGAITTPFDTPNYESLGHISVCKSRGGNLYSMHVNNPAGGGTTVFQRSTDSGATWSTRTSPFEANGDRVLLIPSNDTDNQDIACIYLDNSTTTLSFKLYDDSANTWGTETNIDTGLAASRASPHWGLDVVIRHSDGKAICSWWTDEDTATADLKTAVLTLTAAGANSTNLTNVLTDTGEAGECAVFMDQATDDVTVFYVKGGTWDSSTNVFYKTSTDDGSTWGSETQVNTTAHDIRRVWCSHSVTSGQSGRLMAMWSDEGADDMLTNYDSSVAIGAGGGPAPSVNSDFFFAAA